MIRRSPAASISGFLERDAGRSVLLRLASSLWARSANPVRPVALSASARVVGVGGPTLGGSYKTPVVLALARALAARNVPVSVVAHGYRTRGGTPRLVLPSDDVRDVGDDALWLARELRSIAAPVVLGSCRSAAIALAASRSSVVLVDGLVQASPTRLGWSLLAVDGYRPWGAALCPPAGDLRAPVRALLDATDDVCEVVDREAPLGRSLGVSRPSVEVPSRPRLFRAWSELDHAASAFERLRIASLSSVRTGVLLAVARPERILASLDARGVRPVEVRLFGDHRWLPEQRRTARGHEPVDLWLTTGKCASKLGPRYEGSPVFVLEHRIALPDELVDRAEGA